MSRLRDIPPDTNEKEKAVGGVITYLSFKPCCDKLKESLQDTVFTNPNRANDNSIIDVEIEELNDDTGE